MFAGGASGALFFPYLMNVNSAGNDSENNPAALAIGMQRSMYACSIIAFLGSSRCYDICLPHHYRATFYEQERC